MVAGAVTIASAAPYFGYAAIDAAFHNIQNIACVDHTQQYFACKSRQSWLYISANIALIYACGNGVGGSDDDDTSMMVSVMWAG